MARVCPHCGKQIPASLAAAYSDVLSCPHCQVTLRVSDGSRILGAFVALLAGLLMWRLTYRASDPLAWLLPEIYALLTYSGVFAVFVMATADLIIRPADAPVAPVVTTAHSSHH